MHNSCRTQRSAYSPTYSKYGFKIMVLCALYVYNLQYEQHSFLQMVFECFKCFKRHICASPTYQSVINLQKAKKDRINSYPLATKPLLSQPPPAGSLSLLKYAKQKLNITKHNSSSISLPTSWPQLTLCPSIKWPVYSYDFVFLYSIVILHRYMSDQTNVQMPHIALYMWHMCVYSIYISYTKGCWIHGEDYIRYYGIQVYAHIFLIIIYILLIIIIIHPSISTFILTQNHNTKIPWQGDEHSEAQNTKKNLRAVHWGSVEKRHRGHALRGTLFFNTVEYWIGTCHCHSDQRSTLRVSTF